MALLVRNVSLISLPESMKTSHMLALMYSLKQGCEKRLLGSQGAEALMRVFLHTGAGDGGGIGRRTKTALHCCGCQEEARVGPEGFGKPYRQC